jgi:hypothetical protein
MSDSARPAVAVVVLIPAVESVQRHTKVAGPVESRARGGSGTVSGGSHLVEVFTNPICADPEGKTFIGSVTTSNGSWTLTVPKLHPGQGVTASATNSSTLEHLPLLELQELPPRHRPPGQCLTDPAACGQLPLRACRLAYR